MPQFKFDKLIRDKILQMHIDAGHDISYRKISGEELKEKLRLKIFEEADEVPIRENSDEEIIEEIADIQQVLDDLKIQYSITDLQVSEVQSAKFRKKGGFENGVFVESVRLPEDDEWVQYYRNSPEKYPEIIDV